MTRGMRWRALYAALSTLLFGEHVLPMPCEGARMKARIACWLRRWADRLDDDGAVKRTPFSFTFEAGSGVKLRQDSRGCPLYYCGEKDYARAHEEADTLHPVVDWKALPKGSSDSMVRYAGKGHAQSSER